jgi:hypothetical protein
MTKKFGGRRQSCCRCSVPPRGHVAAPGKPASKAWTSSVCKIGRSCVVDTFGATGLALAVQFIHVEIDQTIRQAI